MTESKNPLRTLAVFVTVGVGVAVLVAVGSYFLIGVFLQ